MAMQRIPLHSREKEIFTPTILADLEKPPTFTLKASTRADREDLTYSLRAASLRRHDHDAIREATVSELCRLWVCNEEDENVQLLKRYWLAVDEYNEQIEHHILEAGAAKDAEEEAPAPIPEFEHPDRDAVDELIERLARKSTKLARMSADNLRFQDEFPRYAVAHALSAWTELDAVPRFEEGVMDIEAVRDVQDELKERFGDKGVIAFTELAAAAVNRFYLTKEAEKNSSSGPASQQTPTASKETGSASPNGSSPASDSSEETPAS